MSGCWVIVVRWASHLLEELTRPAQSLEERVDVAARESGLAAALEARRAAVGKLMNELGSIVDRVYLRRARR